MLIQLVAAAVLLTVAATATFYPWPATTVQQNPSSSALPQVQDVSSSSSSVAVANSSTPFSAFNCTFNSMNLSSLSTEPDLIAQYFDQTFALRLCGVATTGGCDSDTMICQYSASNPSITVARPENVTYTIGVGGTVYISTTNGDETGCSGTREIVITVGCGTVTRFNCHIFLPSKCWYSFELVTPLACPNGANEPLAVSEQ